MDHGMGASDHGFAGHHHQDYDGPGGDITAQALFVAHGSHGPGHFSFDCPGAHTDYVHSDHVSSGAMDRHGTSFNFDSIPTVYDDGTVVRGYGVHVARHAQVPFMSQFIEVAQSLGLIPLDLRPSLEPYSRLVYQILALDAWDHFDELDGGIKRDIERFGPRPVSLGFYPGATGHTVLFRQNWQIGKRAGLFSQPSYDSSAHTYLELSLTQWSYIESGDFETLMQLRVISQQEWDPTQGTWTYLRMPFEAHQNAAIQLYKKMMQFLAEAEPNAVTKMLRASVERSAGTVVTVPEEESSISTSEQPDVSFETVEVSAANADLEFFLDW